MSDEVAPETRVMRNFSRLVAALADGAIEAELSDMMDKVTQAITVHAVEHGGNPSGSITLKLTMRQDGRTIDIKPAVSMTLPEAPRPKTSFWVTAKNQLTLDNPQQGKLFQTVAAPVRQFKDEVA